MKTIGYIDRGDGSGRMKAYNIRVATTKVNNTVCLFNQKRVSRIREAFADIKGTGNIDVYLIYGNKHRLLFSKDVG